MSVAWSDSAHQLDTKNAMPRMLRPVTDRLLELGRRSRYATSVSPIIMLGLLRVVVSNSLYVSEDGLLYPISLWRRSFIICDPPCDSVL